MEFVIRDVEKADERAAAALDYADAWRQLAVACDAAIADAAGIEPS